MKNDKLEDTPVITIVIPVINEENYIEETILSAQNLEKVEIIVVDGGSRDKTIDRAVKAGARVIHSPKGRAKQLNCGAREARAETLLFLHADTRLPADYAETVQRTLSNKKYIAGAFKLSFSSKKNGLNYIAKFANWRSQLLQIPYGDQGLFLERTLFKKMNGFAEIPIMEDLEFACRLRKKGKIKTTEQSVTTSARRWEKKGLITTTLINQLMVLGYLLRVPLSSLAEFYGSVNKG